MEKKLTDRKYVTMNAVEFRNIWNKSASIKEVAEKTGRSLKGCMAMAWYLRRKHIMCKKFKRGRVLVSK